jgi:hypothetical protein
VWVTEECVEAFPLHISIFIRGIADGSVDRIKYFFEFEAGASAEVN